jgi:nitrate/nitrite transporter NarK
MTLNERRRDSRFFKFMIPAFILWLFGEYFFPIFATDQLNVLIPYFMGLGWSPESITDPGAIGRLIGLPVPLLVGWLIIKFGPKKVFCGSIMLYGISELLIATHFNYTLFAIGMAAIPGVGLGVLMSTFSLVKNWFRTWRGTALGIVTFISPIGNATSTSYMTAGANGIGFTPTMTIIAGIVVAVGLVGLFIIRNRPEDVGCHPDGALTAPPPEVLEHDEHVEKINFKHIFRHKEAWAHMVIFGICGMSLVVYPGFFIPRFQELGFSPGAATAFTYGFSLLGGFLSLISGIIDDKLGTRNATIMIFVLFFLGTIGLRFGSTEQPWMIWIGIISLGGIVGAYPNLNPSMVAYIYGRKSFDRVFMYINTGVYILPALGLGFVTRLFAINNSYNLPYMLMIPISFIGLLLVIFTNKKLDLTVDVEREIAKKTNG